MWEGRRPISGVGSLPMRMRDWAGTILVACLAAAAGLLRNHTDLLTLLGAVVVLCVVLILWDVLRNRHVGTSAAWVYPRAAGGLPAEAAPGGGRGGAGGSGSIGGGAGGAGGQGSGGGGGQGGGGWRPTFHPDGSVTLEPVQGGKGGDGGGDAGGHGGGKLTEDEADRRVKAAQDHGGTPSLHTWFDQQIQELHGLLRRLEEVLSADPFERNKAYAVQEHLWEIVRDVDRRLRTSAPEWVDYFNEDHARYPVELAFPKAELYANQLVPAIQSTIDQIAHIRARLT